MKVLSGAGGRERVTDLYLITILLIFPLFPGFSGYSDITFAKYAFLLSATGLWLAALIALSVRERRGLSRPEPPQLAALLFLAVCAVSWLCSPYRMDSFLGAGRFDGLLTLACYALGFLGVSAFTRPKLIHAAAFAVGIGLCCALGVMQMFGLDPLRLFPGDLGYYDAGTLYSGVYLGTIGNTNILDAALCAALPLCFTLYVCGQSPLFLLPLLPCCFVLTRAGGSGAAIAFAVCALVAGPAVLTGAIRLRRALRGCAACLVPAAAALAYHPGYVDRALTLSFALSPAAVAAALAAAALFGVSFLFPRFAPSRRALRRTFLLLDAAAVLGGLAALGTEGAAYELSRVLHGELEDSFGSSRVQIWRACLALVPERPLLGGGPGTLPLRLNIEFSRCVPETGKTLTSFVDNAHNIYIGYLVNCGALGLAAFLGLLGGAARRACRFARQPMVPALALSVLCAAVHGLFGLGLCISEPFFWVILGLLCARREAIP